MVIVETWSQTVGNRETTTRSSLRSLPLNKFERLSKIRGGAAGSGRKAAGGGVERHKKGGAKTVDNRALRRPIRAVRKGA